jgi:hypothetical protein
MIMAETHKIKTIEYDVFSISLRGDDLYFIEIKEEKEFTIANMPEVIIAEKELGGKILPIIIFCNKLSYTNTELMNHLAKKDSNPYSLVEAYILTSLNQRILANFYTKVIRPSRPTKFFKSEQEALVWIAQYR